MTLIKSDLVNFITDKITSDRKASIQIVEGILRIIKSTLAADQEVIISGFGSFNLRVKKARVGRNPKTGVQHQISARKVVTFSPSKILRQELNP